MLTLLSSTYSKDRYEDGIYQSSYLSLDKKANEHIYQNINIPLKLVSYLVDQV